MYHIVGGINNEMGERAVKRKVGTRERFKEVQAVCLLLLPSKETRLSNKWFSSLRP